MSEKKPCVAVALVTYNRKELLGRGLDALFAQTHKISSIVIVDNASTDGTPDYLFSRDLLNSLPEMSSSSIVELRHIYKQTIEVIYVRMPRNTGGAGGFAEAVPRAAATGCDWVWIMDDDVRPAENCLEILIANAGTYGAIMPVRVNEKGENRELSSIEYDLRSVFRTDPHRKIVYGTYPKVSDMPDVFEIQNFPFDNNSYVCII